MQKANFAYIQQKAVKGICFIQRTLGQIMRSCIYLTFILIMCSCGVNNSDLDSASKQLKVDTIAVTEEVLPDLLGENEIYDLTLVRIRQGDSLLIFRYLKDTALYDQFEFGIKGGHLKLLHREKNPDFAEVDTFSIRFRGEDLLVHKLERINPPIDGDYGILFNEKYGKIGASAYSWNNYLLLTKWNGIDTKDELKAILLNDSVTYMKRKNN